MGLTNQYLFYDQRYISNCHDAYALAIKKSKHRHCVCCFTGSLQYALENLNFTEKLSQNHYLATNEPLHIL